MEIKRTMLLKLDVLASTTIKRKKPWPKLAWLGKVIFKSFILFKRSSSFFQIQEPRNSVRVSPILVFIKILSFHCFKVERKSRAQNI